MSMGRGGSKERAGVGVTCYRLLPDVTCEDIKNKKYMYVLSIKNIMVFGEDRLKTIYSRAHRLRLRTLVLTLCIGCYASYQRPYTFSMTL